MTEHTFYRELAAINLYNSLRRAGMPAWEALPERRQQQYVAWIRISQQLAAKQGRMAVAHDAL